MNHQQNMDAFDDWKTVLSTRWHMDVVVTDEQKKELSSLLYTVGVHEMYVCIDIVGSASETSRSIRYLVGVIRNRQKEVPTKPIKSKDVARPSYIYQRCDVCWFVNKVRRDQLESKRGKAMQCGGIDCNNTWLVDDVLKQHEGTTQ